MGSNIVIFALMNINVILLLFLLYLIARNVVKLIFERKQNIFGHRLRTKLVITFFTLSLIPTIVLFGLATQFISSSMEYWYNIQVEQSLKKSLQVAQSLYLPTRHAQQRQEQATNGTCSGSPSCP
jgi:two-component system nitrogen regulation sensor histidine kinase NtrY